ncbi:MAG: hypothetical protein GWO85_01585, partial [Simkaniaceae bacterium]|nr:hypothetical protein [Simkaniaceae bacterium]
MCLVTGITFGQIQLVRPSVASTDDPLANVSNPAGLGFTNHTETMIYCHYNGEMLTRDFALYSQNGHYGFGYEWNTVTGKNIWTQSYGFKLSNSHTIGMTYSFYDALWKEGRLNLGWMHRPLPYLSLGVSVTNVWSGMDAYKTINTGIAIQNKTGRFGLNIDGAFLLNDSSGELDIQTSTYTGLFVEPVKGVRITGYADISGATPQYGISLSLFMPDFGVESHSNPDYSSHQTFGFRTSVNPYRTVFKGKGIKKNHQTFVRMHLDGLFIEEPESKKSPFNIEIPLMGSNKVYGKQLKKFIDEMDKLTDDKSIDGLIIDLGYIRGGFSKLAEIRNALQKFHDAGKRIIVYSKTGLSNKGVFLTSMANEIYTHEM